MRRSLFVFSIIAFAVVVVAGGSLFIYPGPSPAIEATDEGAAPTFIDLAIQEDSLESSSASYEGEKQRAKQLAQLLDLNPNELKRAARRQVGEGEYSYTDVQLGNERSLRIDSRSGRLIRYLKSMQFSLVPEGKTRADAIPEEHAREVANKVIVAAGVPQELLIGPSEPGQYLSIIGDDLRSAVWLYMMPYRYKDKPVMGGAIVKVCAYDGSVVHFVNSNFVPPRDITPSVTSAEAIKVAGVSLQERGFAWRAIHLRN